MTAALPWAFSGKHLSFGGREQLLLGSSLWEICVNSPSRLTRISGINRLKPARGSSVLLSTGSAAPELQWKPRNKANSSTPASSWPWVPHPGNLLGTQHTFPEAAHKPAQGLTQGTSNHARATLHHPELSLSLTPLLPSRILVLQPGVAEEKGSKAQGRWWNHTRLTLLGRGWGKMLDVLVFLGLHRNAGEPPFPKIHHCWPSVFRARGWDRPPKQFKMDGSKSTTFPTALSSLNVGTNRSQFSPSQTRI